VQGKCDPSSTTKKGAKKAWPGHRPGVQKKKKESVFCSVVTPKRAVVYEVSGHTEKKERGGKSKWEQNTILFDCCIFFFLSFAVAAVSLCLRLLDPVHAILSFFFFSWPCGQCMCICEADDDDD
jgi:hypothetical protein